MSDISESNIIKIPKIINMSYKNIPPGYVFENWKKLNPDYEINFSLDSDCINFLRTNFNDYFTFDKLIKFGNTNDNATNKELYSNPSYSNLKKDTYQNLLNHFTSSDMIHLSGYRWHSYYRIILVNILRTMIYFFGGPGMGMSVSKDRLLFIKKIIK